MIRMELSEVTLTRIAAKRGIVELSVGAHIAPQRNRPLVNLQVDDRVVVALIQDIFLVLLDVSLLGHTWCRGWQLGVH
jgi:hypothetical protein